MPLPKIDRVKLNQLLRSGKSGKEVAQVFGVTEGAISRARKGLNVAVVKNVALENAHKVVDKNLDAIHQLQNINRNTNEILDQLMEMIRREPEPDSQARNKERVEGERMTFKGLRELVLKFTAEVRGQLSLQLDIFKTLYDVEAIAEFQKEVLEAIGEADANTRNRITERLKARRALRPSAAIT